MEDKDIACQIFDQLQEEYDVLYKHVLTPDIQESCEAQWLKSNRMMRFAVTEKDLDEIILRAKKLIKWCEFRYRDAIKNRKQEESKDIELSETISNK